MASYNYSALTYLIVLGSAVTANLTKIVELTLSKSGEYTRLNLRLALRLQFQQPPDGNAVHVIHPEIESANQ